MFSVGHFENSGLIICLQYICVSSCLHTFEVSPPSSLAGSWLESPHPPPLWYQQPQMQPIILNSTATHQDTTLVLFFCSFSKPCFSFLSYHCSISYYTGNTWKEIMKQTLSCTDLFILSQSKAVSVSQQHFSKMCSRFMSYLK